MPSKLIPLEAPFPPEVDSILEKYPKQNGYLLRLFRVFAQSLRFLTKCVPNLLDDDSPLSLKEREIVILRTTANTGCEYEWGVHITVFAKAANLSLHQAEATRTSDIVGAFELLKERVLIEVVDQLMEDGSLDAHTLVSFREYWSKEEQLEICALCGTYQTISYVANISDMSHESFAARFPDSQTPS
jgi:alkylhydroperoxidase family enzyme